MILEYEYFFKEQKRNNKIRTVRHIILIHMMTPQNDMSVTELCITSNTLFKDINSKIRLT